MKIDWKVKLSSRKFWFAIAGLATAILGGVVSPEIVAKVTGIISALGVCVIYILGESHVDASRESGDMIIQLSDEQMNDVLAIGETVCEEDENGPIQIGFRC